MEEVEAAKKRCRGVIERIQTLSPSTNINDSCKRTLLKLAMSELNFLSRFSSSEPITAPLRNPKYDSWDGCGKSKGLKLRVEQVLAAAEPSWTLKTCSVILFFGNGVGDVVRDHLREEFGASECSLFDFDSCEEIEDGRINVLPRSFREACVLEIQLDFGREDVSSSACGVENSVVDASGSNLGEENAKVDVGGSFGSLLSQMKFYSMVEQDHLLSKGGFINIDTTALCALVSGISNGCAEKLLAMPEIELRQRFEGNILFVIPQAMLELQNPIHEELAGVIVGKRGMICNSLLLEFKELVSMCGGPHETFRADQLLKRFMIVDDSPSERMMGLPTTRKLALKNKVVFGTGDRWHAPTLTANMAFVRAVSQTGMSLSTIEHRPRALTGD